MVKVPRVQFGGAWGIQEDGLSQDYLSACPSQQWLEAIDAESIVCCKTPSQLWGISGTSPHVG